MLAEPKSAEVSSRAFSADLVRDGLSRLTVPKRRGLRRVQQVFREIGGWDTQGRNGVAPLLYDVLVYSRGICSVPP